MEPKWGWDGLSPTEREKELAGGVLWEGHPRWTAKHVQRPCGGKKLGMFREYGGG